MAIDDVQSLVHEQQLRQVESDVAERKPAEAALQQVQQRREVVEAVEAERERLNIVLDMLPAYVILLSPDYRVPFANRFFEERFGKSDGRRCYEYLFDRTEPCENCESYKVLKTHAPHRWEWTGPDGRNYDIHDYPFTDVDGTPLVMEVGLDITERKQAEAELGKHRAQLEELVAERTEELRASEEQFRRAIEDAPIPVIMQAEDGEILQISRAWTEQTGYTLAELSTVDTWLKQAACGEGADEVRNHIQALFRDGRRSIGVEFAIRTRDGELRHWSFSASSPGALRDGRRFVVGMAVDITDRKRAEFAAEAANEAKSRFLANISHELRTPMNAILGMIDLALPKQVDASATDLLRTARGSADLLLALLNDLLDCSKIEAGRLDLESAPFSLRQVLDSTTKVLAMRAGAKGVSYRCSISPDVPDALTGDELRLRQVVLNLAGNGIKFTEQGEVAVSVRVESQSVEEVRLEFSVRDTGIGIPHSELERIFQPFVQADRSTTRRFGGTGLGLAICSSLVSMMDGRIWAESEPGQGSTFYFTARLLPAKELPAESNAIESLAAATSVRRILLVEDNPANQKLAAYILTDRGHTVEIAENGEAALKMTQENRYDAILMDVSMPGMDGLEATAAIRARQVGERRTPIIAMTAHAMKGDRERCLAAGMDGYLSKPIDAHEMIVLVENLAGGASSVSGGDEVIPSAPGESAILPDASVFDRELATEHCLNNRDLLDDIVRCFSDDYHTLLPEIRLAMHRGDLATVGRLGHRLKGTISHLGAERASEAARRVEHYLLHEGDQADAEEAVQRLQCECERLMAALGAHRFAVGPPQRKDASP